MKIKVKNKGAELVSVLIDEEEFIWNKEEYWAKSSPILFPFVGMLKDNKYIYNGKEYDINTRHGFARDMVFDIEEKENLTICTLCYDEKTLEKYPFKFKLQVIYEILNEKQLNIKYIVENLDDKEMYFSIGAHPAFYLPGNMEDYYIKLDNKKELYNYTLDNAAYLSDKQYYNNTDKIVIKDTEFINDALIFDGDITKTSSILSNKTNRKIVLEHSNFPYIAYWKQIGANFVCIEPWYGITDTKNTDNILENKLGIQKLKSKEKFQAGLNILFEK